MRASRLGLSIISRPWIDVKLILLYLDHDFDGLIGRLDARAVSRVDGEMT
jgi:hypothetical protein